MKTDIYLCNWTMTNFLINNKSIILKKTFISDKSFINHICIWKYKCYFHVDLKSLLKNRWNKFMNWEWVKVFMKYIKKITKQYLFWASDLKWIIKNYVVKFTENKKKNSVKLNLQK